MRKLVITTEVYVRAGENAGALRDQIERGVRYLLGPERVSSFKVAELELVNPGDYTPI